LGDDVTIADEVYVNGNSAPSLCPCGPFALNSPLSMVNGRRIYFAS
jgi:hypothetical protein